MSDIRRQWVSSVSNFSSQYDSTGWSAEQVIGPPKVYPKHGDIRGAWASGTKTNNEFIEVVFLQKVYPTEINIYETYNAGGTRKVEAKTDSGTWVTIYEAPKVEVIKASRIFKPPFIDANISINILKITIDCTSANTWVEIDAVELVGTIPNPDVPDCATRTGQPYKMAYSNACTNNIEQWASVVYSFSSEYDSEGWAANQVIGPPQVYPQYGDIEGAWASEDTNSVEYIEIGFEQQVIPSVIKLYETYHAGGISKIMAKNPAGHWVTLYTAPKLEIINSSRVFSPNLTGNTFETNQLWIEIDSSLAKSWVEIDAVQLIGSLPGHYDSRRRTAEVENITQWVAEVTDFSSQYNSSGWSASSVIGVPKVYPRYGDIQGAWASADKNADQFIQVKFQKKVFLREINIYETYHAGGVKKISAKDMQGNWVMPPHFPVDELRLDIDCTACGTWVEIDAVNIVGTLRPAAVEFDLPGLSGLSMRRLTTHTPMTADNAIEVYTEANREPVLEFVSKLALQIMVQHSNSIKKHAKFNRLPPNVQKMISSESEGTASVEKKKSSIKRNSSDNANRTVTDSSCNPLATLANTSLLYVPPVLEHGYGIKSLHGVVNRTLSLLARSVSILSDTFRDSGTMFMATLAEINQSIHSLGSRIKSLMLDLVGKGSVVAGDWLDIVCDVVIRFTNGTASVLAQGSNTVQNTTSESMASLVSWTHQIGTGIRDHISHFVSSLSFKDLCRLTFILFLLVLLLTALWLARSYAHHIDMVNKRVASLAEENSRLRLQLAAELNAIDAQRADSERAQEALERQIRNVSMWLNVYTTEINKKMKRVQPNNKFISRTLRRQHLL
ncbi:uncharacterized protein LOC128167784 [Crassostrea angulata]|uniref:uncharacterized protein LOC128167784 n=1 Tax=Magallana angulata TaxID=2784310 RepID=UPI0022B0F536|nr:uncharacterized protein LOC128167784 [Crassostrea angulata]